MNSLKPLTRSAALAFDFLSHPVWVFSVDTLKILASNRAAQEWLSYGGTDLEDLTIADLRPPEERDALRLRLQSFEGEETDGGIWTILAKDGKAFRVSFHWQKVIFDEATAIVATIQDKTEVLSSRSAAADLMATVEDLRDMSAHSELRFRQIFEAAPGKLLVVRPRTHEIVAVTEEYASATLTDRTQIYGRSIFEDFPDDPKDPTADGVRNLRASLERVEQLGIVDVMHVQKYPVRRQDGVLEVAPEIWTAG